MKILVLIRDFLFVYYLTFLKQHGFNDFPNIIITDNE
jgi:hypothetical protein